MSDLFESIRQFCVEQGKDKTYWLGLSGGLDSVVLLHLLVEVRTHFPISLHAVHIHHGLSPHADNWMAYCQSLCDAWHVPFFSYEVNAKATTGESQEEIARKHRYKIFQECIGVGDILLTAHHQNDQAETVLLQLLRGAGPKGLAAMPRFIAFFQGYLARPLLSFSRAELEAYARFFQLQWIEDESNLALNFSRNFIRHEVMPLLKNRWPSVAKTLTRVAAHCADTQDLLESYLQHDLTLCEGSICHTLSIKKLKEKNEQHRRALIRYWLQKKNVPLPASKKMQHILHDVIESRCDKQPCVKWANVEIRRYRDELYLLNNEKKQVDKNAIEWNFETPLLMNEKKLIAENIIGEGICKEKVKIVSVRFRKAGEMCYLPKRKHHHALKKLFQECHVPPWLRNDIPLLFLDDELISIVGYFIAEPYRAKDINEGWVVKFCSDTP